MRKTILEYSNRKPRARRYLLRAFTTTLVVLVGVAVIYGWKPIAAATWLLGWEGGRNGNDPVLDWHDAGKKVAFRVTEQSGLAAKQNSRLHVERDGASRTILIDDDAIFSTVAFVRRGSWLLVVCRGVDEVWAGYDFETGRLYGEGEWEMLPFTKWTGQGEVVAERRLRDQSASPLNFRRRSAANAVRGRPTNRRPRRGERR